LSGLFFAGAAVSGMAGAEVPGMAGAALPGAFCERASLAGTRVAIAAAKRSQRGSKRSFLVIILGIPCLYIWTGERKKRALEEEKGSAGSR
jgi:hypothetical protein